MSKRKLLYYFLSFVGLVIALVFLLKTYYYGFFKETATGLQYQVVSKGSGPSPQEGEMLLLNLCYKNEKGKVLFNTEDHKLPMTLKYSKAAYSKDGGLGEAISMLQKGDSLIFKLGVESIFGNDLDDVAAHYGFKKDDKIFLHLYLQDIMTEEVYKTWENEQIAMLQKRQQEEDEKQLQEDTKVITSYLAEHQLTAQTTPSGLFYKIDTPGKGLKPNQGDKVKVNYTGWLLDGKVFDTSLEAVAKQCGIHNQQRTYEPLEFQLGAGQIIQGWEEGIGLLQKGTKARLFIPSTLAYRNQDVGNGLIPPNSVLIFEVELVDIQQ